MESNRDTRDLAVMDESSLTREERMQIKRDLIAHGREIRSFAPEIGSSPSKLFAVLEKSDYIFSKVRYPGEAAYDLTNLRDITRISVKEISGLISNNLVFSQSAFIQNMHKKFPLKKRKFDWMKFSSASSVCIDRMPRAKFGPHTNAPLKKIRKVSRRRVASDKHIEETRIQHISLMGATKDRDPTHQRIKVMNRVLKQIETESQSEFDFAEVLVNPHSFTQTVENIFDFTHFLKAGSGSICMNKEEGSIDIGLKTQDQDQSKKSRQCVITFTKADFDDLVDDFGLMDKEPILPARPTGPSTDYFDPLPPAAQE